MKKPKRSKKLATRRSWPNGVPTLKVTHVSLANAFDAWLDENIMNPEKFEHTITMLKRHSAARLNGLAPTYGDSCVVTLLAYLADD